MHKTLPLENAQNASQTEVYSFFNPHFFGLCVRMVCVCEEVVWVRMNILFEIDYFRIKIVWCKST